MSTYLQMFFQLYCYCSRVTYINYNKKLWMTSPEAVIPRWSVKKLLLKLRRIHRKMPVTGSLFNKVAGLQICNFIKRDSNTGVLLWFCNIFKNTYFEEHLRTICRWKVYLYMNQRVLSQIFSRFSKEYKLLYVFNILEQLFSR